MLCIAMGITRADSDMDMVESNRAFDGYLNKGNFENPSDQKRIYVETLWKIRKIFKAVAAKDK